MIRNFRLFCRLSSGRGVPVIIDIVQATREIRVRYGDKIQAGSVCYPHRSQVSTSVRHYLADCDGSGRPFRIYRKRGTP